jgi:hypothetical protein
MREVPRTLIAAFLLAVTLSLPIGLEATDPQTEPAAPIPTQILTAKKIFISNGGEEPYSNAKGRAYDQFYAAMKKFGRYEIVGSPSESDVVFEIRATVHSQVSSGNTVLITYLNLAILDPKTRIALWTKTEDLCCGFNLKTTNGLDSLNKGMKKIMRDVEDLADQPIPQASPAKS